MTKNNLKLLVKSIIKESIILLRESFNSGEWWIYPGGDVQFADGNIGDSGHEGYVIEHLVREILEFFHIDEEEPQFLNIYEDEIKQYLIANGRLSESELEEWDDSPSEIIVKKTIEGGLFDNPEQADQAVYIAYGSTRNDPRDYAMQFLKWKRLDIDNSGVYVQSWTLTSGDLRDISRGIDSAISDDYDDSNESSNQLINIEIRSNNNYYKNIPIEVLDSHNIMKLANYRVRAAWINESVFHKHDDWVVYEGHNKITTVFKDNTNLSFEVGYPRGTWAEQKDKWRHKAATKWKALAREIYSSTGLSEVGNPIVKPWKTCYQEALKRPEMKEFLRKNAQPIF
jgi:hypothetical protein